VEQASFIEGWLLLTGLKFLKKAQQTPSISLTTLPVFQEKFLVIICCALIIFRLKINLII